MKIFRLLLLVAILLLSACGASAGDTSQSGDTGAGGGDADSGAGIDDDWVLIGGVEVPTTARVTLSLDRAEFGGSAACNGYAGTIQQDGEDLSFAEFSSTAMGCEPAIQQAETDYLAALSSVTAMSIDADDHLVLTGVGTRLTFERLAPVPTAALVGTEWTLEALINGVGDSGTVSTVMGSPTLQLADDGAVAASTGCRSFEGTWVIVGDEVQFTTFGAADPQAGACAPEVNDQENHVLSVLGDGFIAAVEGDRLTLMDGALGLSYRSGGAAVEIEQSPMTTDMSTDLVGTSWLFSEGTADKAVMDASTGGPAPTLQFSDSEVMGSDTCNNFGGEYSITPEGRVSVGPIRMTRKFCEGNRFDAFVAALERVTSATFVDDGQLYLTGDAGLKLLFITG